MQAKHLADTCRVIAIGEFGFFGYHALSHWTADWVTLVWSAGMFVGWEIAAIWTLKE
ncbi:MAG TPA: hypothetical protein VFA48_02470 [Gammaproteobacteria bacterium]|nr:hypothetical protein [Gammaproteobacteria bacterium]